VKGDDFHEVFTAAPTAPKTTPILYIYYIITYILSPVNASGKQQRRNEDVS